MKVQFYFLSTYSSFEILYEQEYPHDIVANYLDANFIIMDNWSITYLNKDPHIEINNKTTTNIIESILHNFS
jgi:hypothetical protein